MTQPKPQIEKQAFDLRPPAALANVVVVLVHPEVPGNIGSSARAMKTMGLQHLTIVDGPDFLSSGEARKMGHRSWDILESARRVATFEEAVADAQYVVGTTHRHRGKHLPKIQPIREAARPLATRARSGRVALVFGTEDYGLTDDILQKCNALASVPTARREPSLNLSQAVMICCHEVFLAALETQPSVKYDYATVDELEQLYERILGSLMQVGFKPHHGRPESFKRALRRVFGRAPLEKQDLRLLYRMFQQVDYYVRKQTAKK